MPLGSALFLWLLMACIGGVLGERRGHRWAGFLGGLLAGPIGWLWIVCDPSMQKPNPPQPVKIVEAEKAPTEALLDLKRLLDAGAITQAEYEAKKAELLARV